MTEPNEATTPLSRMRFSWQRGSGRPGAPAAPDEIDDRDLRDEEDWSTPSEHPGSDQTVREDQPAEPDDWTHDELPEPRPEAPNGHSAVATEPFPDEIVPEHPHGAPPPPQIEEPPAPGPKYEPDRRPVEARTPVERPVRPVQDRTSQGAKEKQKKPNAKQRKDTFQVPPPGGRFSGGRSTHVGLRVALILTTCLLALGIVAYIAFSFGVATMRENQYRLSEADIARYNLTDFPLEQAGRFAADYARLCLTHSSTPGAADQREARLAQFVSGGTDPSCGWNGEGVQTVTDSTWTGSSEPIDLQGYKGHARMMVVRVITSAGSRIVTVPVYVADLVKADGMRIIGDLGEMPQPRLANPPPPTAPAEIDDALSKALVDGEFFRQFFDAWGSSNDAALQRFVTPDALPEARVGLGGTLSAPVIDQAQVFFPAGVDPNDTEFQWKTGMVTEAWVWVVWNNRAAGKEATERRAYRLQLVKTTQAASPAQEWAVRDIRGGVPDLDGS
jgi:hypothetical protein